MKAQFLSAWWLTVLLAASCGIELRGQTTLRDFGDAPAPYPTLLKDNGASHVQLQGFQLGTRMDIEADGQPNATATGDDTSPVGAPDDEDGVTFTSPLIPGQVATLDVVASATGRLDAWLDFNGNGSWADSEDRIFASVVLAGGVNHLSLAVPPGAKPGTTFARFRLSRQGGLNFTGPASDGEVEDYQVIIRAALDFGDAPDPTYPTTIKNNGARHQILEGFHLGALVDAETDGQPNAAATGDDFSSAGTPGDEDGVVFPEPLVPGQTVGVEVTVEMSATQVGRLDAWIDFDGNGSWADLGEKIFDSFPLVQGVNKLSLKVPSTAKIGDTYARFRLSTKGGLNFTGLAPDGEVEDYLVHITDNKPTFDFGDAPEQYPTLLSQNGARHLVAGELFLGKFVDAELDGHPSGDSLGDDNDPPGAPSDEDGIKFVTPLIPGQDAKIEVVSSGSGLLDAWVDFASNGTWADEGDRIFGSQPVVAGLNSLSFHVPATARPGGSYSRFRLSRKGGLNFDGPAADGEVEDYQVRIETGDQCVPTTNKGTDFWLTFPGNYAPDPTNVVQLTVCLVGNPGITGTVSVSGSSFSQNFTIPANMAIVIKLPKFAGLGDSNDVVLLNGVHVTASDNVAVFGLDHIRYSTDGYLGLPKPVLGTEYIVQGYGNVLTGAPELAGSQFALVACDDNTSVTITPSVKTGLHPAGVPYSLTLQQGQTYQLRNTDDAPADLAGTIITSDKPIAAFGGHMCANIPTADMFFCDYVVEQLLPTQRWGVNFVAMPLATRNGDTYRCLASQDGTTVTVNGVIVATLNRGETRQFSRNVPVHITSDKPIYVAQYANSADFDGVTKSDPFMLTVPPTRMFLANQMVCTAHVDFPDNYLNVVAPAGAVGAVLLDGAPIPAGLFVPIAASGFSGARVSVAIGPHSVSAPAPVGVSVYGFAEYDSYGWPGGLLFGDSKPPTLTCPSAATIVVGQGTTANCVALVPNFIQGVTVTDNCDDPARLKVSQSPAPGTPVGPGVYSVVMSARDSSGNVGTCFIQLTVLDLSPVSIQCPGNITASCSSPQGKVVTFQPDAKTQCGTPVDAICDPPSGSVFPVGVTRVVCRAGSPAVQQASCGFTVTVTCLGIAQPSPGKVTITWTSGVLQTAPAVTGPWRDLIDTTSPFTLSVGSPSNARQGFFRVKN